MEKFSYYSADKESIHCNFCEGNDLKLIAVKDHKGLDIQTCICKNCGLIFINPRMIQKWYQKYYEGGEYRVQRGGINLNEEKLGKTFLKRSVAGEVLAEKLGSYFKKGLSIDVGSGVGGLLSGFKNKLELEVLGIEPSVVESNYANSRGIKTLTLMVEDISRQNIPPAKNIICTQALNHFLNPRDFFIWAYNHLEIDGVLYLEVKDFLFQARKAGGLVNAIQLDHTYMFIPDVLADFVKSAGFDIVFYENDQDKSSKELGIQIKFMRATHTRLVAIKSDRAPFSKLFIQSSNFKNAMAALSYFSLRFYPWLYNLSERYGKFKDLLS